MLPDPPNPALKAKLRSTKHWLLSESRISFKNIIIRSGTSSQWEIRTRPGDNRNEDKLRAKSAACGVSKPAHPVSMIKTLSQLVENRREEEPL